MEDKFLKWLRDSIGQKLISVLALIYVHEGVKDFDNPQELSLKFSSTGYGKFKCSYDGASIDWQEGELHGIDMDEFGSEVVEDLSGFKLWQRVLDKVLVDAELLYSSIEDTFIGVKLSFNGDNYVSVINLGDELFVYQDIPEEVMNDQRITCSGIT